MKTLCYAALCAFALLGCTQAEWHSINRQFDPGDGDGRLIDAKQRAIIAVERPKLGSDGKYVRDGKYRDIVKTPVVCAEPSPDALQATAAALALNGNVETKGITSAIQAALSNSEGATSIGLRTQTIQLLRDAYYRLCESYLNDGTDAVAYDILQRRYQNQIIALLAVEQLTGVTKAAQNSVTAEGAADAGANLERIFGRLKEVQDRRIALDAQTAEREAALETAKNISVPDGDEEAKKAKEAKVSSADAALMAHKAELENVKKLETSLQKLYETALANPTTATTSANAIAALQIQGQQELNENVVHAVRAITINALNQDYEGQVCFETLRTRNHADGEKNFSPTGSDLRTYCRQLLAARSLRQGAEAEAVSIRNESIESIIRAATLPQSPQRRLSAADAATLLIALNETTPLSPEAAFLAREISFPSSGDESEKPRGSRVRVEQPAGSAPTPTPTPAPAQPGGGVTFFGLQNGDPLKALLRTTVLSEVNSSIETQQALPICGSEQEVKPGASECSCKDGFTANETGQCVADTPKPEGG